MIEHWGLRIKSKLPDQRASIPRTTSNLRESLRATRAGLPTYSSRPLEESSCYCGRCGAKQRRKSSLYGPGTEELWRELPVKEPRITAHPVWRKIRLAWLVSPPNPPDPTKWYRERLDAVCPKCGDRHNEKDYRRQFGLFGQAVNCLKALVFHSSFEIIRIP